MPKSEKPVKLTKTVVESRGAGDKDILLHDSELKGFRCKITPKGKRTYYLYYRTANGQQRNPSIGVHGSITCEQARAIAKKWLGEIVNGEDPSKKRQDLRQSETVEDLWHIYREARTPHLKPSSMTELSRLWDKYLLPEFGKFKAVQLESATIRRFHQKNIYRLYTANRMLEAIRSTYNYAIDNELISITRNPCAGIKKHPEKKRERFLSMQEITNLSEILQEVEHARTESQSLVTLIRLLMFTGCRLSEILNLKWDYIDYDNSCFRLPDSKTGAKTVYVSAAVLELLSNTAQVEDNPYVIIGGTKTGQLAPPQKAWQRIRKQAGLDDVRLHDLRHSFASVGAASGMSLPMIGALLGHSQAQTTERYAHLIGDPLKQAANVIGDKITAAMIGSQADIIELSKHKKQ